MKSCSFFVQISGGHPSKKFISNKSLSGSFKTFIKVRDNIIVNEKKQNEENKRGRELTKVYYVIKTEA